jgi:exodeoxyribonuclease VII large subunit
LTGKLDLLSPKSTLARGYSITRTAEGRIIRKVKMVKKGEQITTMVLDGQFGSVVSSASEVNESQ